MSERISRRTVLRAAGAAIALPWLESLPAVAAWSEPARDLPKRFAVLFMGNGVNGNHWWSRGNGAAMTLGRSLQPLEPLKQKINVIHGLFNPSSVGMGIHPAQTGNLLSGVAIAPGQIVRGGITVDQVLANRIGSQTPLASLVLACERPLTGLHETGFAMAYSPHRSGSGVDSPVASQAEPRPAFNRVCGTSSGQRQSVLDRVKDPAARLARRVSRSDGQRVDGYLADVRDVESRADRLAASALPDLREHARLMCDIIALAFQVDATRVASLLLARDLSSLSY